MPRKIKRIGNSQTFLFEEEPSNQDISNAVLPKAWDELKPKRSYRLGSLADKIRKGIWIACSNCGTEDIEFVSDAANAWLSNEKQLSCPICGGKVSLE